MSKALRRVRDEVRSILGNTDNRDPMFVVPEIDQAIARAYLAIGSRLPAPSIYVASAFTISAGGDTFTLPNSVSQWTGNDGGAEYTGEIRIQLASTGEFLRKVTLDELDAFRNGSPSVTLGVPYLFCLWEETDQDVQGRCYPGAQSAEVCNLFTRRMLDDLRDFIGAGTDDLDDVEVQFSRIGTLALAFRSAAMLVAGLGPKKREEFDIGPEAAKVWLSESETLIYQEAARRHDVEENDASQRRVS